MSSAFEDFPNELLLLIFNHLSGADLLLIFSDLNQRFSCLLKSIPNFQLDFSSRVLSKIEFVKILRLCRSYPIESIRISDRDYVNGASLFISAFPPNEPEQIQSVCLIGVDRTTVTKYVNHYPHLTHFEIDSTVWRSMPRRLLPPLLKLTRCRLPRLDLLHGRHSSITDLVLDHSTPDELLHLNFFVPNLRSLRINLNCNQIRLWPISFPSQLNRVTLILQSLLFQDFRQLVESIGNLRSLTVNFKNARHDIYSFDEYLSGNEWRLIFEHTDRLQINILLHQAYSLNNTTDILSEFDWFTKPIHCEFMEETHGFHLYSLPLIENLYQTNFPMNLSQTMISKVFKNVNHLYLIDGNIDNDRQWISFSSTMFYRLRNLTMICSTVNETINDFIRQISSHSMMHTFELSLTTNNESNQCQFKSLINVLPSTIETVRLNRIATDCLIDLLENTQTTRLSMKRLCCSVQDQIQFDILLLFLLEMLNGKDLICLNLNVEQKGNSSNLLSDWLKKSEQLKHARIAVSGLHCSIWI